ncbi:hypothetical protein D5086_006194 [Populus alba]|uniref:Uncharacterized protein n=1 Tax=Populus alba TaxID=43335 RepID=A0ACC4CKN6_POPAL
MVASPISALDKNARASYGGLVPGHNHGRYLPLVSGLEMSFFLLSRHTSNAYLNKSTSTEAHPSPGMTKKMYVSPSGSLEDMALKGSILSSPHVASLSCHQDSGNVIDDPSVINDPPQDASLIQSKRPYMTRSKSLFIPFDTLISVVNIASRRPS